MNDEELEIVEGAGFMAVGELSYARANQKLFEVAKSNPEMLVSVVDIWLNEWVRMAEEMVEQCAVTYIYGSKGPAVFDNQEQMKEDIDTFITRMQKMRDDAINNGIESALGDSS